MQSPVEIIKEKLSIVDVISSYTTVVQAGKNYKARCPFHNEKTPSFFISPDRGSYYCFGCGAKGDIFSFVEKFEGTDFFGSLKLLAARAGVSLSDRPSPDGGDEKERYYALMEEATIFYESALILNKEPRAYIRDRGLTEETIQSFRVGYAPEGWRSVSDHLLSKGYTKDEMEKVGLIKISATGFYDRFRSRIMFPISDSSGRVIAFSGRIFGVPKGDKQIEEAKYINSPDSPLYNKSHVLFGIHKAKTAIRTRGYSIIVEGQMDLLLSHQASFTNTVAVSGTAFADTTETSEAKINNLGLVRRLSPNIIFAFDGDEAGIRAAHRASLIALSLDMQVKIALLPEGKDPADIIRENPENWKDSIKNARNIVTFTLDRICMKTSDIRLRGARVREDIFPLLSMVTSAIERSAYMTEIHTKTGIGEKALLEDFVVYEKAHPVASQAAVSEKTHTPERSRRDVLEQRFCGILFWYHDDMPPAFTKRIDLFKVCIGEGEYTRIIELHDPYRDTLVFEAERWYGGKTEKIARELDEILLNLEEELLNEQKQNIQPLDTEDKLITFKRISQRIEEIKKTRSL